MWPTIVTCQAQACSWNQYSTETKVSSCTKLMILLNKVGVCTELTKYQVKPGTYKVETDISEITPDEIMNDAKAWIEGSIKLENEEKKKEEKNGTNTL